MHALYLSPIASRTGFARAAEDYALALHRAGMSLEIEPLIGFDTDDIDERYAELLPLMRGFPGHENGDPTHVIVHCAPFAAPTIARDIPEHVARILVTTWETMRMPESMRVEIDAAYDMVVVPSEFCRDAIGMASKVQVVPHCFDPAAWPAGGRPFVRDIPYRFLFCGVWTERKNPVGLLKAYLAEFSSEDDVELVIHSPARNAADFEALVAALGYADAPAVTFEDDYLDHDQLIDMHLDSDCFVTAARGEGWNLPAFEAALVGNPVISPAFGGQMEFLDVYRNAYAYGGSLTPVIVPPVPDEESYDVGSGVMIRAVRKPAPGGITARQRWFEPDLGSLQHLMRRAYTERWTSTDKSRAMLEQRFSYATVGRQFRGLIESIVRI